jgi:hypothetical protein
MRRIALEIFDDPERCSDGYAEQCKNLSWDNDGNSKEWFWCSAFGGELERDGDTFGTPLRCPECKAAELKEISK